MRHALKQGNIGARTQLQVDVRHLRKLRADWVSNDQFHATFTGPHNARACDRVAMYRVATGGQQQVGDINIPHAIGTGAGTEDLHHPFHGCRVTNAGTIIDVVGTDNRPHQL